MSSNPPCLRLLGPIGIALAIAQPAWADDAAGSPGEVDVDGDGDVDADDDAALKAAETIMIRDKSDGQRQVESARAVTVVDLAQAHERTADLGEVLSRTHGIQIRRTGGLGSTMRFSLNGLYDDQIRTFYDGIPLRYAGWAGGLADVPVQLIQRVDVYRGVVPVSLGADALGGAVDLVTDPSWTSRGAISYQLGSYGTHRASAAGRVRDPVTSVVGGISLFVDRAANDYPIDVEITDERGKLVPARVRRFHDDYTAGGVIVEGGVVRRGAIQRAIVRAFSTQSEKQLQHNIVMSVPYGEAESATSTRGVNVDVAIERGAWRGRVVGGGVRTRTTFRDLATVVYDWYGQVVGERAILGETGDTTHLRTTREPALARRARLART
ncbi:MAG: TonB-dependent receptor plug domain-containing protein, partial [Myxococcales bacterium]|nr:TonB-dependent receptor plug domain-containing protein [Myxococcales bacterium]